MRPLNVLIPVIGLAFFAAFQAIVIIIISATTGSFASFEYFLLMYIAISIVAILAVLRNSRIGFLVAAIVSALLAIFVVLTPKPDGLLDVLSNPVGTGEFVDRITTFPLIIATLAYSILGLQEKWPKQAAPAKEPRPAMMIPRSSLIAALAVGFIIGGLVVGLLAGATLSGIIAGSGTSADIIIVQGAGTSTNGQFYVPANFTVNHGSIVAWVNHDTTAHTVTSSTAGLFDSENMNSGALYRHTFPSPGEFQYVCTYHSWMKGTITVT